MSSIRRSALALVLGATFALTFAAAPFAKVQTTGPGSRLDVFVKMTDHKIQVAMYALSDYAGPSEMYMEDPTNVVRGEVATFTVINAGKKAHNFVLLGKKTPTIKPGKRAKFTVSLLHRGAFAYHTTVNTAKGLTGTFVVN